MKQYKWNPNTNCFDEYVPIYTIKTDNNGVKHKVIIPCAEKLYTEAEVDNILNNRPQGTVIKDIGGVPSLVMYEGE